MKIKKESITYSFEKAHWARHCKEACKQKTQERIKAGIKEYLIVLKYWDVNCKSMLGDSIGEWVIKNYWVLARNETEAKRAILSSNELVNFPDREIVSITEWRTK